MDCGFKELLIERFMLEYQDLHEGMNLVQIRHTRSLKYYVHYFKVQINAKSKMDEFSKKCNLLSGLQKWIVDILFKFPKLTQDMAGIINIAKKIKIDGPKRKSSSLFQQNGLSMNEFQHN